MKHSLKNKYENVRIRQLEESDLEYLREWRNNPANTKYLNQLPYITIEMQKSWYHSYLADDSEMIFAIEETIDVKRIVGSMALYNFEEDTVEFGKILIGEPQAHGKSVGVNALEAIKKIAKSELGMKSIYLHVYKDNIGALKVYEKSGFVVEDTHFTENGFEEYTMRVRL